MVRLAVVPGLFLASFAVAWWADPTMVRSLWPAVVAVSSILVLRNAAFGLGCGVVAGAIVITSGDVMAVPRVLLADHAFPALQGPWRAVRWFSPCCSGPLPVCWNIRVVSPP